MGRVIDLNERRELRKLADDAKANVEALRESEAEDEAMFVIMDHETYRAFLGWVEQRDPGDETGC